MLINDLLKLAIEKRASDLHLKVGSHPVLRVNGELTAEIGHPRLQTEDTLNMSFSVMNTRQKQKFKDSFDVDVAYSVPGLGRFRCNVFQQRGTVGLVIRLIPLKIQTIRELLLPPALTRIADSSAVSSCARAPPARANPPPSPPSSTTSTPRRRRTS